MLAMPTLLIMTDANISPWIAIALELILIGISICFIYIVMFRQRLLIRHLPTELGPIRRGPFTIIYFTTSTSALAGAMERQVINKLQERLGNGLEVLVVDMATQPELANHWRIETVPATVLIDPNGELISINLGVVRAETLLLQMYGIEIPDPTKRIQ